jgi:MFS family permease
MTDVAARTEDQEGNEQAPPPSLWHHPDFLKLWAAHSLSLIGSQVTLVALPLVAVAILNATTSQMGILTALGRLPYILILFVGVFVDRVRRKPMLIISDLARGVLLLLIPILYFADQLTILLMFGVMLAVGFFTVIFDVSWAAYLPTLVERRSLAEGNSKLQFGTSTSEVAGPGITAILLKFFSSAAVLLVDAVSYFVSAALVILIGKREEKPVHAQGKSTNIFSSIREGLHLVWNQPLLRPTLLATAFYSFFVTGIQALYFLYAYNELGVSASWIAIILALGGPGAMLGSALGPRIINKIGLGRMCVIAALGGNTSFLFIPLATKPTWLAIAILSFGQLLFGFTMPLGGISVTTIRQAVTPDNMQGRVQATFRAFGLALAPFGALAAGFAAGPLGLRATILIGAIGALMPILFLFFSPLPKVRGVEDVQQATL